MEDQTMRVVLSDAWLRAVKPPAARRIEVRDIKSPGLVVRITPSGVVSWAARGRRPDGREARITIGTWPQISLAEARRRALRARAAVADGVHPTAERRALRQAVEARAAMPTVAERLAEWQAAHERRWSDRYAAEVARLCTRELIPVLGARPLSEVDRQGWTAVLATTARRSASVANMLYKTVASFLSHADAHGWIAAHPLPRRGASRIAPAVPSRERVLSDDELRRVWEATTTMRAGPRCFVRLLIATGCRLNEAAGIAVGEFDPATTVWRLPAPRAKNNRLLVMPIPAPLMAELEALTPDGERERMAGYRLLGRTRGGALSGFSKIKAALDAASGVSGWRFHDLRRVVRSKLAALGVPPDVAERCLNHVSATGTLAAIYDRHDYEAEILAALRRWQRHLAMLVGEKPEGAEVVPLRRRRRAR
jgi:integrase